MTTTTIHNHVIDAGGNPLEGVRVDITLMTGGTSPGLTNIESIGSSVTVQTDVDGAWSAALRPNDEIVQPAGTFYQVSEGGRLTNIMVPAGGGTYTLSEVLTGTPPRPATQYIVAPATVAVEVDGTTVGARHTLNLITGDGATIDAVNNAGSNRIDVTIGADGGGGAVDSVNGHTGVVVLTASDVSAAPTTRQITAGTGLTGGGTLAADRTLAVSYGTTAGTAVQGNDSRIARPGVFNIKSYGAVVDNSTDDTAAVNAAVAAAVTYAEAGPMMAVIEIPPGVCLLSGATTASSTNKGNAQIPLPVVATSGQKLTLVFRGLADASALPHWEQTTAQLGGSVLRSTISQDVDGTFGPPSVIGGPTPAQGYGASAGLFNNILVVVENLAISVPSNPKTMGLDFSGCAQMVVRNVSVNASTTPGSGEPTLATHSAAVGLYATQTRGNDLVIIDNYSCEGMAVGMILSEHADVRGARIIYCNIGVDLLDGTDCILIGYISVELCKIFVQAEAIGGGKARVRIAQLDCETTDSGNFAMTHLISDPDDLIVGDIYVHEYDGGTTHSDPNVNGGNNARIINVARKGGAVTAPGMPSSGVALKNPFYRDAAVIVHGGTVSDLTVDGTSAGITSGSVIVPSGRSITPTYSAAPSWAWTLL